MMYILVIDQGTSSTRAVLFDEKGQIKNFCAFPLKALYPKTGWVEHHPEVIWSQVKKAIKHVSTGINAKQILACGITNQRETTVIWDKRTGKCLYNAIVWQDRRTQDYCNQFHEYHSFIRDKTGLFCSPYFSASKINWLLNNLNLNHDVLKYLAFGTIDSFLLWRMTGGKVHKTDMTNASRTLLFNIKQQTWDSELLELFSLPENILPQVCDSDAEFGHLSADLLGAPVPIIAVLGDQQSALLGIGACLPGDIKVTYGTGGFVMTNMGEHMVVHPDLLTTIAYRIKNQTTYAQEGFINDAGSSIYWLKEQLGLFNDYAEAEYLAASVQSSEGVCFIPSFSGLGSPYTINTPGAYFTGLSRSTTKAHLVRAVFDSIMFQTKDIIHLLQQGCPKKFLNIKVDGGMAQNLWFLKELSILLQKNILIPEFLENTAKGVALLAISSLDSRQNIHTISQSWQNYQTIFYSKKNQAVNLHQEWLKNIKKFTQTD